MSSNQKHKLLYCETENGVSTRVSCIYNVKTDYITISSGFMRNNSKGIQSEKGIFYLTTDGVMIGIRCCLNNITDNIGIYTKFEKSSNGGFKNNKSCSQYLGIYISERILSNIYPNVKRMNITNPGYDFLCGKGHKIDVKSTCLGKARPNQWSFHIRKNKVADYFLCLGFDNRKDLNPKHVWLIPGHIVNNKLGAGISKSTLKKWEQYEQPIDKIITCCDTLRDGEISES